MLVGWIRIRLFNIAQESLVARLRGPRPPGRSGNFALRSPTWHVWSFPSECAVLLRLGFESRVAC